MPDKEGLSGSQRANEEDFFYQRDRELVEKLRFEAEARIALRELGVTTGITDETLLRDLQRLGFNRETAPLLELAPVVSVAWSDGSVNPAERKWIFELAQSRDVREGTSIWAQLAGWLEIRPRDELFDTALRAVRTTLETLPEEVREGRKRALISQCSEVAGISGGFLGLGSKTSDAEQTAIRRITEQLEAGAVRQA